MASQKILEQKQEVIKEIAERVKDAASVVLFDYRGLTDKESKELRKKLKENGADYKIYKNTLMDRAFKELNIDMGELEGPSALAYGDDQVLPVKTITDFAKSHNALSLKIGIIDGEVADEAKLKEYASLPSREGLLTMLAGGMIGIARDLSIALNLYAEQKDDGSVKSEEKPVEEATVDVQEESTEEKVEEVKEEQTEESSESEEQSTEEEPKEEVAEESAE